MSHKFCWTAFLPINTLLLEILPLSFSLALLLGAWKVAPMAFLDEKMADIKHYHLCFHSSRSSLFLIPVVSKDVSALLNASSWESLTIKTSPLMAIPFPIQTRGFAVLLPTISSLRVFITIQYFDKSVAPSGAAGNAAASQCLRRGELHSVSEQS